MQSKVKEITLNQNLLSTEMQTVVKAFKSVQGKLQYVHNLANI